MNNIDDFRSTIEEMLDGGVTKAEIASVLENEFDFKTSRHSIRRALGRWKNEDKKTHKKWKNFFSYYLKYKESTQ